MGTTAQKLAYLNETKTKIKNAINLGEAGITNETFRQYEKGIKQALLNTMNDKWSTWNNFEKVTETGENISANQTVHAPMALTLKGNTSQDTTTGKNLFDYSKVSSVTNYLTLNNDVFTYANGAINSSYVYFNSMALQANTTYSFDVFLVGATQNTKKVIIVLRNTNGDELARIDKKFDTNISLQYTPSSDVNIDRLQFYNVPENPMDGAINFKIQIEKSEAMTDYEPYTNGASPNPDYPQQIHVVSGDNTIKVEGINLAYTGWASDFVSRINDNTKAKLETYDSKNCLWFDRRAGYQEYDTKYLFKIKWKENTQYTINVDYYNTGSNGYSNMKIIYTDNSEQEIYSSSQSSGQWNKYSITSQANKTIKYITTNWRTDSTYLNLDNFMVYEGTEEKSYQPYQSQTYPINLGELKLCKIGDYQDYFTKNSSGQWCKYNAIGKVVLDGSESWSRGSNGAYYLSVASLGYSKASGITCMSNYFLGSSNTTSSSNVPDNKIAFYNGANAGINELFCGYRDKATASDFETWLSTHNTIVYYVLNTPYLSLIEDETLISQLDNIENAMSYEGQTNISQVNDDKPFIIEAIAIKQF